MSNKLEASILKLIAEQFGLGKVHPKDRLIEDLKGDALDAIELVMRLEEEFNVQFVSCEAKDYSYEKVKFSVDTEEDLSMIISVLKKMNYNPLNYSFSDKFELLKK